MNPDIDTLDDGDPGIIEQIIGTITSLIDAVIPGDLFGDADGTVRTGTDLAGETPVAASSVGFYESLPGVDSGTGVLLGNTTSLMKDVWELGEDTLGEQEWRAALDHAAATDPYGLAGAIESPSEMQARFASQDAAAESQFLEWQHQQATLNDADDAVVESERLNYETDWLVFDTDQMLYTT